jgi:putative transposase
VKLKPTKKQRTIIDDWINTSNYVFNKAVSEINEGHPINAFGLRDKLVTNNTKKNHEKYKEITEEINKLKQQKKEKKETKEQLQKIQEQIKEKNDKLRSVAKELPSEKNNGINEWEHNTPKEVRMGAIQDVCKAYKTGFTNLKQGNIKHFKLGFRKKSSVSKSVVIPKNFIKVVSGNIQIAPTFFKDEKLLKIGKRTKKKLNTFSINHDARIVKQKNDFWIFLPRKIEVKEKRKLESYCGIDAGIRTFMTSFGNQGCKEYEHNQEYLNKLNNKINELKKKRTRPLNIGKRLRTRKRNINKLENKKSNYVDEIHWKTIQNILDENDFVFYGDFKSHEIVKNGKNKKLNKDTNELKFYKFKQRLLYKASIRNKCVFSIKENYTTKTCCFCGTINNPECSKVYHCSTCKRTFGRDVNAAKNILMKGIIQYL